MPLDFPYHEKAVHGSDTGTAQKNNFHRFSLRNAHCQGSDYYSA